MSKSQHEILCGSCKVPASLVTDGNSKRVVAPGVSEVTPTMAL